MEAVKIITLPPSENPASAAPLSTSAASLGRPKTQSASLSRGWQWRPNKCVAPAM